MDNQRTLHAKATQCFREQRNEPCVPYAEHDAFGICRIGQRTEHIEYGMDTNGLAQRRDFAHDGMKRASEKKTDAVIVNGMFDGVARHVQIVAEFGQHIRRAALAGNGSVAVFCNRHTRARRDKRGGCRDIERRTAVAACADHIDTWFGDMDLVGVFSQILRCAN